MAPGVPILYEPECAATNCPLHKEAAPPGRRRSPTRNAGSSPARGLPFPRRSKLEVANERNRKLLASRTKEK